MFADYRESRILRHLRMLMYSPPPVKMLETRTPLASRRREELSIRAASVVAIEYVCRAIARLVAKTESGDNARTDMDAVSGIDFYLWDLAKPVEG